MKSISVNSSAVKNKKKEVAVSSSAVENKATINQIHKTYPDHYKKS
jgi:hypothetical protein